MYKLLCLRTSLTFCVKNDVFLYCLCVQNIFIVYKTPFLCTSFSFLCTKIIKSAQPQLSYQWISVRIEYLITNTFYTSRCWQNKSDRTIHIKAILKRRGPDDWGIVSHCETCDRRNKSKTASMGHGWPRTIQVTISPIYVMRKPWT